MAKAFVADARRVTVERERLVVVVLAFVAALGLSAAVTALATGAQRLGVPWLEELNRASGFINWCSFLLFFVGLGELHLRSRHIERERRGFAFGLLPEDFETVIDDSYIPKVFQKLRSLPADARKTRLADLVELCAAKYHTSAGVGEVSETMRIRMDVEFSRMETAYSLVRYLAWAIPVVGFIGTVLGLSDALKFFGMGGDVDKIGRITQSLALAFNTTFVALILAFILVYLYHRVSEREEGLLTDISDYCLKYFVAKAYFPPGRQGRP